MQIKYININKRFKRDKATSPTHDLVVVLEDGSRQYIGSIWYSETKSQGSIKLNEDVKFEIGNQVKVYPPKEKKDYKDLEDTGKDFNINTDEQQEKYEKKKKQDEDNQAKLDELRGEDIDPKDIPF